MQDPVVTADGHTYERKAIEDWLNDHDTSPLTGETLPAKTLIPNIQLRVQIQEFIDKNPSLAPDADGSGERGSGAGSVVRTPPHKRPSISKIMQGLTEEVSIPGGGGGAASATSRPPPPPLPPRSGNDGGGGGSLSSAELSLRQVDFVKGRPIGLDLDDHLCVRGTHSNSQGFEKGIKTFETIIEINASPVKSVAELRANMSRIPNNTTMALTFLRPVLRELQKGTPFGLSLTEGMYVKKIAAGTQAATKGILLHSRLLSMNLR